MIEKGTWLRTTSPIEGHADVWNARILSTVNSARWKVVGLLANLLIEKGTCIVCDGYVLDDDTAVMISSLYTNILDTGCIPDRCYMWVFSQ